MFLRFYRMLAVSIALLIFGTIASSNAWAIDVTVTNAADAQEDNTSGRFTISTDAPVDNDTVVFFTVLGTATRDTDYSGSLDNTTILSGTSSIDVTISPIADNTSERDETIVLTLTSTDNASVVVGTPSTATINLIDDDEASIRVEALNNLAEDTVNPAGQFSFISTHISDADMVISYDLTGSATLGTDYTDANSGQATITAGNTQADITLTMTEDTEAEGLEDIIATITSISARNAVIETANDNDTATITLTSNDTVNASIVSGTDGTESGTNGTFLINLSAAAATPITIEYLDNASTADNGTDYTNLSGSVTIPAGATTGQINIAILDDNASDAGEVITLALDRVSAGPAVIASPSSASINIVDNDQALATISSGQNASEAGADNATFTIDLDQPATSAITVSFSVGGTSTVAIDYSAVSSPITFATGEQSKTLAFTVIDDSLAEGTETLVVQLDSITGPAAIGSPNSATRLIVDNDTATLGVNQSPTNANEGTSTDGVFVIETDTQSPNDITVSYAVTGTAASGNDFTALSGTATIAALTSSIPVNLLVLDDAFAEDNETVTLTLQTVTAGSAVIGSDRNATLIIEDNDTVAVGLGATTNTSEDNTSADGNFIVNLAAAAQADITVGYSLSGSADNNTDYAPLTGSVTIAANATTANVVIDPVDDALVEGDEAVTLTLINIISGPGSLSGTPNTSLTIADNDNASISISGLTNGAENGANAEFLVSSNGTATENYDISYSISGTAVSTDYTDGGGGTIRIPAGNDNATLSISIVDDAIVEDNETLTVTLTAVTSGSANLSSNDNASVTITSDDRSAASIVHDNASEESGLVDGTLVVSLDNSSTVPITFAYTVGGTATSGTDYTALGGSVTFPSGSTEQVITVDVLDDAIYEDNETVVLTLSSVTSGPGVIGTPDNATHIITSDDNVSMTVAVTAHANEPSSAGTFEVTLGQAVGEIVSFDYTISGTATGGGTDYNISGSSPASIAAGATSHTITVTPVGDLIVDDNETVIIQIDNITTGPAALSGSGAATMYVYDNNTQTVSIAANDNGSETGPDNASMTVSVPSNTSTDIVLAYSISGTATSGSDFTALSGSVQIDNGSSSALINIPVLDDAIDEDNETVIVTLTGITSGPGRIGASGNSATITIEDNDSSSVSITVPAATDEGEVATFTVTLSSASSGATTVTYTDNGTATSGTDYTAPSGSLVIAAGSTTGAISIPILADGIADDNETLSVTLTAITGTAVLTGTPSATTTIGNVTDKEAALNAAAIATRKMIREDLDISLDNIRRTARAVVSGSVDRLSDENNHDYEDQCSSETSKNNQIDIEAENKQVEGYGKYRKVKRRCYSNEVTIVSADFNFSDDGKGNETGSFNSVFATERTSGDLYNKYGRYIELSVRNREQNKTTKGEIDTIRMNVGGYMAYRASAASFLSSYITFGASQSTYDMTHEQVKSSGSFMAINAGTGVGLTGEMKSEYLKFSPNVSLDVIATGYSTFKGDFKLEGKTYQRDIEQSIMHKATFSFEPVLRIYSSSRFAEAGSVTTLAPSIFCASGSLNTQCGYSFLAQNVTRDVMGTDFTTKLAYEENGDITTMSLSLNANTHLFGNSFIRLGNEISAKKDIEQSSSTKVTTDPYMSYKVYIEMLY